MKTALWVVAGLVGLGISAYVVWRWVRGLRNQVKVLKSIGNLRAARIRALEAELAARHASEREKDKSDAETARGSDRAAADFLFGAGGAGRGTGGPVPGSDPTS